MRSIIYLISTALLLGCTTEKADSERPNVLFIAVDDLRPELNCYGVSSIKSPAIDKLADQSAVFTRAYCNVPVCGASRASLLSGARPTWNRFVNYYTRLDKDYPEATSLPGNFKNNGYTTISNGKVFHDHDDDSLSWDEAWRPEVTLSWRDYQTEENQQLQQSPGTRGRPFEIADVHDTAYFDGKIAQKSIRDLRKLKEKGEPFFLAAGFLKPHLPFNAPRKYWDLYDRSQFAFPDNYQQPETTPDAAYHNFGELRNYHEIPGGQQDLDTSMAMKLMHGYYACVSYTDAQVGKLLNELDRLGLSKNTIVVLWGDHGWNLANHKLWCKHCNFESSLHVPLMVKIPTSTNGNRIGNIVEFIDIYPTLCEFAGLPKPSHLEGESFLSLINGQPEMRKKNYAISKYHDGVTLIMDNWFYTEFIDSTGTMKQNMLFDHSIDSLELDNLAIKSQHSDQVAELSAFLRRNWGKDFFRKE